MRKGRRNVVAAAAVVAVVAAAVLAGVQSASGDRGHARRTSVAAGCTLGGIGQSAHIKHVVYLQFDNTHYRRDASSVASDLEQMPHLLNFLKTNGTLFTNDHTILISHTAGGILSSLTGLYPDRQGQTVSNSYDYFKPDKTTAFPAEMVVDYVRVYEKVGGYGPQKPRAAGKLPFGR